ncbi:MAG: TatD family hydrolase [Deltaproteobacteria bacterium]|nr:TatD family hydrolase [Deltaproteobacteria bacterium]MBN2688748.1 TatD family hydrolase [Deltaproteobacteria bacterium]
MLIDSHSHIAMKSFDGDRNEVIARARDVGVSIIMAVGISEADCRRVVSTAARYDSVYGAVGIHPHHAKDITTATYDVLKEMAKNKKIVAYGEIGLDFFRNLSPRKVQIARFGEQLDLAEELNLPVIIHDRDAHAETVTILEKWNGHKRGVIHCFSGDYAMARKCLDMGFYLSIPGTITFRKNKQLHDVVRKVPLSRLLVETDCPFLTPDPKRGERNEPAYVVYTASRLAEIKSIPLEEVEEVTCRNTIDVFGIPVT